jgi:hypothetical protein
MHIDRIDEPDCMLRVLQAVRQSRYLLWRRVRSTRLGPAFDLMQSEYAIPGAGVLG